MSNCQISLAKFNIVVALFKYFTKEKTFAVKSTILGCVSVCLFACVLFVDRFHHNIQARNNSYRLGLCAYAETYFFFRNFKQIDLCTYIPKFTVCYWYNQLQMILVLMYSPSHYRRRRFDFDFDFVFDFKFEFDVWLNFSYLDYYFNETLI